MTPFSSLSYAVDHNCSRSAGWGLKSADVDASLPEEKVEIHHSTTIP